MVFLQRFQERCNAQQLKLKFDLQSDLAIVADREAIKRVIVNLLENSMKYCTSGCEICVTVSAQPELIKLSVSDNGAGIPDQILERVFERHFRANTQVTADTAGMGLGLTISREIVEAHYGTLSARSLKPQGVEFIVELPRVPLKHPGSQLLSD